MKMSISKTIGKVLLVIQVALSMASCSDYLNIDNYFDDEFNIDSVFSNARYMEAYMWGAAAMFPDEAQTIRHNYTPGPMATDEAFNGLTGGGTANIYHGMDFANGKITPDFWCRFSQFEPMEHVLQDNPQVQQHFAESRPSERLDHFQSLAVGRLHALYPCFRLLQYFARLRSCHFVGR